MRSLHCASALILSLATLGASAQTVRVEKNMSLELANKIAAATVAACSADKFNVTATVVDRAGGVRAVLRLTVQRRIGVAALARMIASAEPSTGWLGNPCTGISMFDCPEQSHTSPISTSRSVSRSPSLNSIV